MAKINASGLTRGIRLTEEEVSARLKHVRGRRLPVEKTPDQDSHLATRYACPAHAIEFYADRDRCPMCQLEQRYNEDRATFLEADNKLALMERKVAQLEVQVNLQAAFREAIEALGDEDFLWLKLQLYQYKIDKSVSLKPTHGKIEGGKRMKRGQRLPVNGFMTIPRHGDPEAHAATSIGGLAMAEYLDEAISCFGSAQAMGIMLKAWWKVLPGGQK